jgi:hypothetical protein
MQEVPSVMPLARSRKKCSGVSGGAGLTPSLTQGRLWDAEIAQG